MMTNKRQLKLNLSSVNTLCAVLLPLFLCLLFSPLNIYAKTPAEYRKSIEETIMLIEDFVYLDVETVSPQNYLKLERETLAKVRAKLPVTEKIEWQNGTIETNNLWLADKLDRFEREPRSSEKRFEVLGEIIERLEALERKMDELENSSVSNRAKDEDKRKLAQILQREEYQKPEEKQPSLFEKLFDSLMKWLEEMFPRSNAPAAASDNSGFSSFAFILQMLLYAVILGSIGFLVYRFAPLFATKYRVREKREKKERVVLGERLAANETAQNLFAEAERLASAGNLRDAIRKGYIAFLCELSDRKVIGLSQHKTNRDYLRDVRKKDELYENMSGLTNNYERHWYGFDAAEEKDWEEFKGRYKQAVGNQ
ncbi:MAG TPA: DUF4129 domain-containing protein [Pyrinomonadaceae bacterium]|nr:DUF4129 domain-containing protein [Pyrinomonadaceae bacterium]